jgi:hypothetical protein
MPAAGRELLASAGAKVLKHLVLAKCTVKASSQSHRRCKQEINYLKQQHRPRYTCNPDHQQPKPPAWRAQQGAVEVVEAGRQLREQERKASGACRGR